MNTSRGGFKLALLEYIRVCAFPSPLGIINILSNYQVDNISTLD